MAPVTALTDRPPAQDGPPPAGSATPAAGSVGSGDAAAPARPRRTTRAGLVLLGLLFAAAFAGPFLSRWGWTDTDLSAFRAPPSARHWFGTTASGRDVYALVLHGLRKSLVIGLAVAVFSTALAALVGAFAGLVGGLADRILMAVTDLFLVLPAFLVVAVLSPVLRAGWLLMVPLLAGFMWMVTARMVRGATISMREREYIVAARLMGAGVPWILRRHVLPGLVPLLTVDATLNVSMAVMAESGLSYFGFGVQPPDRSLGTLIAEGSDSTTTYPWTFCFASGALVLLVLSVNLVGEGLRETLSPSGDGDRL